MRRINPFALAVMVAAAQVSSLSNSTPLPEFVRRERPADKERLTKAEKKRERKNAQRAKLAGASNAT